jgi:plastocyanin
MKRPDAGKAFPMRTLLPSTVAAALLLVPAAPATAATVSVSIRASGFVPATVTIQTGDRVTWTNRDTRNHQVVADSGAFVSPILRPGQSYTFMFRASGTYRYRDALKPEERGTIRVTGPPPSVSLAASASIVVHGTGVHLQGAVSPAAAGETVRVFAQPHGQSSYVEVAEVLTTSTGMYDYIAEPSLLTNYQVRWRATTSQPVTVQVRPRITFLPSGTRAGWMYTQVIAARSFYRRTVYLQRLSPFSQWVTVARYALGPRSGRLFRRPTRSGTYRIFITINQAGVGYLEGWSGTQRFR